MLELKIEPLAFGIYHCPAEWIVNEKGTVFHRLYYAYGGDAVYTDKNNSFPLKAAHIYLFPANRPYNITHNPDNPFVCMYFHLSTYPLILNSAIGINTLESPAIFHMVRSLEHVLRHSGRHPKHETLFPLLLNGLVNLFDFEIPLKFSDENRLQKVLDYIHEHISEKITNIHLASIAGFDHYYFARLFRKTFGVSPQEYISSYRLSRAQNLIRNKTPIKLVAESVGFQDPKSFSRAFKNAIGVSPSQYSKSHPLQP